MLYLVCGYPASGKTTYCRQCVQLSAGRSIVFDMDAMRQAITCTGAHDQRMSRGVGRLLNDTVALFSTMYRQYGMRVTVPFLMARNYYYNCGCIPGAGQIRACRALKRWLAKHKIIKYGGEFDVKKFYDNLPHKWVMKCLERIFKDKRFLALHAKILKTMPHKIKNGEAVGVAIGFYPSPWYANLVLSYIDRLIKKVYPDCHFARYMDDISVLGNNKRKMHRVAEIIRFGLARFGLELKPNWQIFQIAPRGVRFLSYRFFHGFTILKKPLLYRLARRFSHARRNLTAHKAAGLLSSMGILKHCNSYHFRRDYVYNNVSIAKMKGLVRNEALRNQSRVRPPARRPDCYAFA